MNKWDRRFLRLAREVGDWSKDPSSGIGAIFVSPDKKDVILGFNGFASQMSDDPALYANREVKLSRVIHAEMNALIIAKRSVQGYTLYTYPFLSCDRCAVCMIQAGVRRVVSISPTALQLERWGDSLNRSKSYFAEAGVIVEEFDLELLGPPL